MFSFCHLEQFHSAGVWPTLSTFTGVNVEDLAGKLIHRLENIMSMEQSCHRVFDELFLWLKPVEVCSPDLSSCTLLHICQQGVSHPYCVCEARQGLKTRLRIPDIVTFSTETEYPLPHPAFLALHALCCEVAWISGAAEYILDTERRMDEDQTRVLANDGSTVDVLMTALALVQTC